MQNNKVILLCGFARGGTNIAWNVLQSHPQICSPIFETGELFDKSFLLRLCERFKGTLPCSRDIVDGQLSKFKRLTIDHSQNKYISPHEIYTPEQITNAALCLKSVNWDISHTELLLKTYPNLYFIALTRNGYAFADGYIRRGRTPKDAGNMYARITNEIRKFAISIPRFKLIKFEDLVEHPFETAKELFTFTGMEPTSLSTLRLKAKKVIRKEGDHSVKFGEENRKYWFDYASITQILDPNVNRTQIERLSREMINEFNREAASALEYFGYEIL